MHWEPIVFDDLEKYCKDLHSLEEEKEASTPEVAHRCLTNLVESFLGDHDVDVVHNSTNSTLLEVITLEEESTL